MHFLAHYYTELPNNKPLFVVALTVPDLAPGFSKIYNTVLKNAPLPYDENQLLMHQGILAHYAGDKKFHNNGAFLQQVEGAIQSMVSAGLNRQRLRLSVIAHIAVEMLIDRQILIAQPHVCNDFYGCIDNAAEDDLIRFFNGHGLQEKLPVFLTKFRFFKQRRYVYLFDELQNIVVGLDRIYGAVAKTEFTSEEKERFLAALNNIDAVMRYRWQEILNT